MDVDDVCAILGVSKIYTYSLMREYNKELKAKGKNWKVQVYYKDWQGNRKRKQKRGFRTKDEAKEWEKDFLQQQSQGVDIEFGNFLEIYYKDMDVYNPFQSRK